MVPRDQFGTVALATCSNERVETAEEAGGLGRRLGGKVGITGGDTVACLSSEEVLELALLPLPDLADPCPFAELLLRTCKTLACSLSISARLASFAALLACKDCFINALVI